MGAPLFSAKRKSEAVLRVLHGEDPALIAADLGIPHSTLDAWRREFLLAGHRRMDELPLGMLERCMSPFERLVPIATLISVTIGVMLYVQAQRKADQQQIQDNFNALDDKYIDYAKLCLAHPELDVYDYAIANPSQRTPEILRQESMMFAILTSLLERAYLTYHKQADPFSRQEWQSWNNYLHTWLTRKNFVMDWQRNRELYDRDFRVYVDSQLPATQASTQP